MAPAECKVSFYTHRVARGVSICTTCLLSGFQAITISPSNSRGAKLKLEAPKFVQPASSQEASAIRTVLLLVSSFVSFYSLSSILSVYMTCFVKPNLQLVNVSAFLAACFPALSPFVLVSWGLAPDYISQKSFGTNPLRAGRVCRERFEVLG
ncbi:vomeronasal type-1 receptor 4-like [Dama dama]